MAQEDVFKKLVSHCKEYGFVFPSSEIYDGLGAVYDYGQYGVELKNNLKKYWWDSMDQSLSIICKAIERKFNVKIVIADRQLAVDVFTCHFKESATIEEVMTLLKETRKLNYSFKEGKIVIYKSKNSMPMEKV